MYSNREARDAWAVLYHWSWERLASPTLNPQDKADAAAVRVAVKGLDARLGSPRETDGTDSGMPVEPQPVRASVVLRDVMDRLRANVDRAARPLMPTDVVGMKKEAQLAAHDAWAARLDAEMKAAMDKAADKATPPILRPGQTWASVEAGDRCKVLKVSDDGSSALVASCDDGQTAWMPEWVLTTTAAPVDDGWDTEFERRLWSALMAPEEREPEDDQSCLVCGAPYSGARAGWRREGDSWLCRGCQNAGI